MKGDQTKKSNKNLLMKKLIRRNEKQILEQEDTIRSLCDAVNLLTKEISLKTGLNPKGNS